MKIGAIIFFRMNSSRLPGKPLLKFADKTLIEIIYDRVLKVIELDEINEKAIGSLMMFLFLETIFSCYFINADPFDQPAVEEGKILTKKFLENE